MEIYVPTAAAEWLSNYGWYLFWFAYVMIGIAVSTAKNDALEKCAIETHGVKHFYQLPSGIKDGLFFFGWCSFRSGPP